MKPLLLLCLAFLCFNASFGQTYPFSNATVSAYNSWDSGNNMATALTKNITVTGVPTTGMILRQVNVFLGDGTNNTDLSSYQATLTDPSGNSITLFSTNYFYNGAFDQKFTNIHLRDHAKLKRVADYGSTSYLGVPYNWGYYRVETAGSFATLNTTSSVNGTWVFKMIENVASEVKFNSVELIFGPPFTITNILTSSSDDNCSTPQCLESGGEIYLATNGNASVTYPGGISTDPPLTLGGCTWNAQKDNSAWFVFKPSTSSVRLSISGLQTIQESLVFTRSGTCSSPSYTLVACPNDNSATGMFMMLTGNGSCNASGNPTSSIKYYRTCYNGGTVWNHEYQLSGLSVGGTYYLLLDGQAGVKSDFYIEVLTGADNGCPVILGVDFKDFQASVLNESLVQLNWSTASERNNDHFEVERSRNGIDFILIENVIGAGNSAELLNYTAFDNSPEQGINYYRIKQTDFDGKESFSDIRVINTVDIVSDFRIFPNPSNGEKLFAQFDEKISNSFRNIRIISFTGGEVYNQNFTEKSEVVELDIKLDAGIYFVVLAGENIYRTIKLVVK